MVDIISLVIAVLGGAGIAFILANSGKLVDLVNKAEDSIATAVGGREKFEAYKSLAMEAVEAVQQMSKNEDMTNEQKKETAMKLTKEYIDVAGLDEISDGILSSIVEAQVFILNYLSNRDSKDGDAKN